jgi:hypothetical protein
MAETPYRYWAFISYSHHDRRVAQRLKAALARARIPRRFRTRVASGAAYVTDVFLDTAEAAASPQLSAELQEALRNASHLVVVCSPLAVASQHVENEIAYFQSLGRADRILCLIASGVPNAADKGEPALECFPRPLRFAVDSRGRVTNQAVPPAARPLAAPLGEETEAEWRHATDQLVAGMFEVSVGELARLRRRTRLLKLGGAAGTAALAAGIAGFVWWGWFEPHTGYYKHYVRRFGLWEGVDPVPAAQAQRMNHAYVLTTEGAFGRPTEARVVNGSGRCPVGAPLISLIGHPIRAECTARTACGARFEYADDGSVSKEHLLDQFGRALETLTYTTPTTGIFIEAGFGCSRTASGVENVRVTHHEGPIAAGPGLAAGTAERSW